MLSQIPIFVEKRSKENVDKGNLDGGVIAELDVVDIYEQMAAMAQNENIKKIPLEVAKEEKTHIGTRRCSCGWIENR